MTDQQVQLFLADLAIIILLARLLGMAAKRLGQPAVLGEIIAGILLGPTLFHGKITAALFPATLRPPLTALATLGVVMFMFAVGCLLDLRLIRGQGRVAASVSAGSMILPLALGIGLGAWLASRHHVHRVLPFALFVGAAMSVTAFPVLARILTDRNMHRTRIGSIALASAATDDVLAWALLAVVVALAGAGGQQVRLLLAPVYVAVMFFLVRPLLGRLAVVYHKQKRLTPNVFAAVLAGLLLSSYATDWMGLKYIFGAFLFGVIMPREVVMPREAVLPREVVTPREGVKPREGVTPREGVRPREAEAGTLRQEILDYLEQVSVLVLLPVFFVVSGLSVNLSSIGRSGLVELCLILLVAVAGKFGGGFLGASLAGVRARRAGTLATLMNTRGLTEIVILAVGLQLHILDQSVYSLMIVMAVVTTMMAGPLLHVLYPEPLVARDIAEANRAALGTAAGHRILVLIEALGTAAPLVDIGAALAASRGHSQLILCHLEAQEQDTRPGEATGLGGGLWETTRTAENLQALADRAAARGVPAVVRSWFSQDIAAELPGYVAAAEPDTVVLGPDRTLNEALAVGGADGAVQLVTVQRSLPEAPSAVAARWTPGEGGAAAVLVAAQLALSGRLKLLISPAGGRRASLAAGLTGGRRASLAAGLTGLTRGRASLAAGLTRDGIAVADGPPPAGAIIVTAAADSSGDAHLTVRAGIREAGDDLDQWLRDLDRSRLIRQR